MKNLIIYTNFYIKYIIDHFVEINSSTVCNKIQYTSAFDKSKKFRRIQKCRDKYERKQRS